MKKVKIGAYMGDAINGENLSVLVSNEKKRKKKRRSRKQKRTFLVRDVLFYCMKF